MVMIAPLSSCERSAYRPSTVVDTLPSVSVMVTPPLGVRVVLMSTLFPFWLVRGLLYTSSLPSQPQQQFNFPWDVEGLLTLVIKVYLMVDAI